MSSKGEEGRRLIQPKLEVLRHRTGRKWTQYPPEVVPAWIADMDFPVAPAIQRTISEHLEHSDFGYWPLLEDLDLFEVFAERAGRRFDWEVEPDRMALLMSLLQGLDLVVQLYTDPGDGVAVLSPIYPPFLDSIRSQSRRAVEVPLVATKQRYEIDFERLRRDTASGVRLLLLCNPHNPTGRCFERQELEMVADIALENDLLVVSDEVHADLVAAPHRHTPFETLGCGLRARSVTLTSATKAFNLAGLPCATIVFGSQAMRSSFDRLPKRLLGHPGIVALAATRTAWLEGDAWLAELLEQLARNRERLLEWASEVGLGLKRPEALYLAWLDCRRLDVEVAPAEFLLDKARVALSEGADFGRGGEGHLRLNYATSESVLDEILDRLRTALAS